jgi:hypothetical protein
MSGFFSNYFSNGLSFVNSVNTTIACERYYYFQTAGSGPGYGTEIVRTASGTLVLNQYIFEQNQTTCDCLNEGIADGYYFYNSTNIQNLPPQSQAAAGVLIQNCRIVAFFNCQGVPNPPDLVTKTPSRTPSPTPSPSPSSPFETASPTPSPTNTPTPSPSDPNVSQSPTPSPTPTPTVTPSTSPPCTRPTGLTRFLLVNSWSNSGVVQANFPNIYSNGGTFNDICSEWNEMRVFTQYGTITVQNSAIWTTTIQVGSKLFLDTTNNTECDCVLNGFYVTLVGGGQATTSSEVSQIQILTVVDCFITQINTCSNPSIAGCSVLINDSTPFVYLYDQPSNTYQTLVGVTAPNLTFGFNDIAHTSSKMWMSRSSSIFEWNITLNPFTSSFVTTYTPAMYIGAGLCVKTDGVTLIVSNVGGGGDPAGPTRQFFEFNTTTQVLTLKFPITNSRRVSGDMILTTDNKLIVLVDNTLPSADPNRSQFIQQYNYSNGNPDLTISLTNIVLAEGGYFYAMYEIPPYVYILGVGGTRYQYRIDLTNQNITEVDSPNIVSAGASQLPSCITQSFAITSLAASCNNTNVSVFGANDGVIGIPNTTGGVIPYTYTVNGTATTLPSGGRGPGSYTIVVTDSVGGTATLSCPITEPACTRPTVGLTSIYYANRIWPSGVPGTGGPYNIGSSNLSFASICDYYNQEFVRFSPGGCVAAVLTGGVNGPCGGSLVDVSNYNASYVAGTADVNSPAYYPLTIGVSRLYTNGATGCGCANFGGNPKFIINWTNPTQPITNSSGAWAVQVDPATCIVTAMQTCNIAPPSPQLLISNISGQNPMSVFFNSNSLGGGVNTVTSTIYWGDSNINPATVNSWGGNLSSPTISNTYAAGTYTAGIQFTNNPSSVTNVWVKEITFTRVSKISQSSINPFNSTPWPFISKLIFQDCSIINFNGITCPNTSNFTSLQFQRHLSPTVSLTWSGNMTNLTQFLFDNSVNTTNLSFDFSQTKLTSTPNQNGSASQGSPRFAGNTVLTSLSLILPNTFTSTINNFAVFGNRILATLNINNNNVNAFAQYTILQHIFIYQNALTSWVCSNFNSIGGQGSPLITFWAYQNRNSTVTNSGFANGINIDFTNLINLEDLRLQTNSITFANSIFTNFANSTKLRIIYLNDNRITSVPTLPNTTNLLDLRIHNNLINTSTNPSAIPSLPNNLQVFYGGFETGVGVSNRTETNTIPTWSVALSSTNLTTFYLQGVTLNSWSTDFPSTIQNIYFDVNLLTTFDFTYCQNVKSFSISNNANTLSSLNNINLATTLLTLICQYNLQMNSPNRFFYPQASSSTRYFPATMTSFNFFRTPISTTNQPWSKEIFSTTVVNNITTVTMQNMNLTSDSVNFILNYFYRLCSTSPAGVSQVTKANSCAPNLTTININNSGTINPNSPPTAGTINGINAKTQLNSIGVITPGI